MKAIVHNIYRGQSSEDLWLFFSSAILYATCVFSSNEYILFPRTNFVQCRITLPVPALGDGERNTSSLDRRHVTYVEGVIVTAKYRTNAQQQINIKLLSLSFLWRIVERKFQDHRQRKWIHPLFPFLNVHYCLVETSSCRGKKYALCAELGRCPTTIFRPWTAWRRF